MIGDQSGDANTQIHIKPLPQFLRRTLSHQIANRRIFFRRSTATDGAKFNTFFKFYALNNSIYKNAGRMNLIRLELADFNQFFHFGHGHFAASGDHRVEIAGGFAIDQIAGFIALPRFYDRHVRVNRLFENKLFAVKSVRVFALGQLGAISRARIKAGDTCAACPKFFSKRALRHQLQLQLVRQYLTLEFLVFTHIRGDHFFYLARLEQKSHAEIIHTGIVTCNR